MRPHMMVQAAPVPDAALTTTMQERLVEAGHTPEEHIVDTGSVDAELLAKSQQQGITLVGPSVPDRSWQNIDGKGVDGLGQATCHLPSRSGQRSLQPDRRTHAHRVRH